MGLALAIGDLHFDQAALEIETQRNKGSAFGSQPLMQFEYLLFVHQQPPGLLDLVVEAVSEIVRSDMDIVKQQLTFFDFGESFIELDRSGTTAFDFSAGKLNTCLEAFDPILIVKRLAVGSQCRVRSSIFLCHDLLPAQEITGAFNKFFVARRIVFGESFRQFFQQCFLFFGKIHRSFHNDPDVQITSAHSATE